MNQHGNSEESNLDLTGQTLADYQVLRRLGRGGMAEVYLAEQLSLKRNVALKVLKPELAQDKTYIERFQREAQSAAALVQSNIVQIYEVGEADGFHFISQEYIAGRNLKQYLARFGAIEPVMALGILRQTAMALQKAGESNIIHRDIKPENIMLSSSGEVKVTDFGLARVENGDFKKELTQVGVTMGTPLYMSPEQVEGKTVDPRSDIYSLGITAYHMLAGEPPFDGETALGIAVQHVNNTAKPLDQIRPDIPKALASLIAQMMSKKPADRPESGAKLLKELRRIKIDAEQDWDHLAEKLAAQESMDAETGPRRSSPSQLRNLVRGNLSYWWTRPVTLGSLVLVIVSGAFAGHRVARNNQAPDPIIAAIGAAESVQPMPTIAEQWELAEKLDTLEAFAAVLANHPIADALEKSKTELFHNRARLELGQRFIDAEDWGRARSQFQILSRQRSEDTFYLAGVMGMAIVLHADNDSTRAKQRLSQNSQGIARVMNDPSKQDKFDAGFIEQVKKLWNEFQLTPELK